MNKKAIKAIDKCSIDDLYHYGIKGMKWGVRRYQNEDGTLTELGKKHYAVGGDGKGINKKKTILTAGAAAVAAGLTAYGMIKLHDHIVNKDVDKFMDDYRKLKMHDRIDEKSFNVGSMEDDYFEYASSANTSENSIPIYNNDRKYNKEYQDNLKKLKHEETPEESVMNVNNYGDNWKRRYNCVRCSFALEMRQRGFDVSATDDTSFGLTVYSLEEALKTSGKKDKNDIVYDKVLKGEQNAMQIGKGLSKFEVDEVINLWKAMGRSKKEINYYEKTLSKNTDLSLLNKMYGKNFRSLLSVNIDGLMHSVYAVSKNGNTKIYDGQNKAIITNDTFKNGNLRFNILSSIRIDQLSNEDLNMKSLGYLVENGSKTKIKYSAKNKEEYSKNDIEFIINKYGENEHNKALLKKYYRKT